MSRPGSSRQTGDVVLVTGRTLGLLNDIHGDFVERPGLALKGKRTPVEIYAPRATVGSGTDCGDIDIDEMSDLTR